MVFSCSAGLPRRSPQSDQALGTIRPEATPVPDVKAVAVPSVKLDGVHHFTGVTADVTANIDFWCRVLGLRFVKKTLNFETTFRYHPYYGDEQGDPGSVVTFLEFKELERQLPGDGNIHRIVLRIGSYDAADYWLKRLAEHQVYSELLRLDPTRPTRLLFSHLE